MIRNELKWIIFKQKQSQLMNIMIDHGDGQTNMLSSNEQHVVSYRKFLTLFFSMESC